MSEHLLEAEVVAAHNREAVLTAEEITHTINTVERDREGGVSRYWFDNMDVDTNTDNERVYLGLLNHLVNIYKSSTRAKSDRTNTGTYSDFGPQCVYDLRKGFPLLTTKYMRFKAIWIELIWFLRGHTNISFLHKYGVKIWDEWADENGNLGPVYGSMWRDWRGEVDQVANVINLLIKDPDSRRMIVTGWDPYLLPNTEKSFSENISEGKQALPPCHTMWQVYTSIIPVEIVKRSLRELGVSKEQLPNDIVDELVYEMARYRGVPTRYLDLKLYQRSGDVFLGVPYNIASYSALMLILCSITGYVPRYFIHTFGDVHLYSNHVDQAVLQLSRTPKPAPTLEVVSEDIYRRSKPLADFLSDPETSMVLVNYDHHPAIAAPVAV